ncbi:alpha/beta fold hydrolase [Myxococcota bacterium]|nr:alpha/beta fold hydrolase [Myxococcota bacterium]
MLRPMRFNPYRRVKELAGIVPANLGSPGYYLNRRVERKDDFHAEGETVLLIHGFWQARVVMNTLERRLRADGFRVISFDLGGVLWNFNARGIPYLAQKIHKKLERLRDRGDFGRLHVVGHSKGGLIGKHLVARAGGDQYVRSLITLGTPHYGTPLAYVGTLLTGVLATSVWQMWPNSSFIQDLNATPFPSRVRLVSIYSTQDLLCPPSSAIVRPRPGEDVRNVLVKGLGHMDLVEDPWVYGLVLRQLAERTRELAEEDAAGLRPPASGEREAG